MTKWVFHKGSPSLHEYEVYISFIDFRATPSEALQHPFLKSLFPQQYLTASGVAYPISNKFVQPPEKETELMQRLGVKSLLRLNSLRPAKESIASHIVQGSSRASSPLSKPNRLASPSVTLLPEVPSSSQCESKPASKPSIVRVDTLKNSEVLNDEPNTPENSEFLSDDLDFLENCGIRSEGSDDVLLVQSLDELSEDTERPSGKNSGSTAIEFSPYPKRKCSSVLNH
jgi:hypothetical protein